MELAWAVESLAGGRGRRSGFPTSTLPRRTTQNENDPRAQQRPGVVRDAQR